jgi:hypothetical protein
MENALREGFVIVDVKRSDLKRTLDVTQIAGIMIASTL